MSPSTHRNGRTQATGVVVAVVVVVAVAAGVAGVAGVVARDGQRLCALSALQSTVLCLMLNHNWIFFCSCCCFPPPFAVRVIPSCLCLCGAFSLRWSMFCCHPTQYTLLRPLL